MQPVWENGLTSLFHTDARRIPMADQSVHTVIASPPYFGLRDYQLGAEGIGLEPTLSEWVENIVAAGREVHRVLRDDGTFWLNLGDSYAGGGRGAGSHGSKQRTNTGSTVLAPERSGKLPSKNLMGQPWRVAFALQDDGWILRRDIIWAKPNPMPESVNDRPTSAHEYIFLFSKRGRYFYDAEAIREASDADWHGGRFHRNGGHPRHHHEYRTVPEDEQRAGRNSRSVWTIATQGRPEAHFATFPDELPRRCILAGTSARGVCAECGAPYHRIIETPKAPDTLRNRDGGAKMDYHTRQVGSGQALQNWRDANPPQTIGWQPTCDCDTQETRPAVVLDPFVGSGTTCAVAQSLGRRSIGLDLNRDYLLNIARPRIERITLPMELGV